MVFLALKSRLSHLASEMELLDDFIDESMGLGREGYAWATLHSAVSLVRRPGVDWTRLVDMAQDLGMGAQEDIGTGDGGGQMAGSSSLWRFVSAQP